MRNSEPSVNNSSRNGYTADFKMWVGMSAEGFVSTQLVLSQKRRELYFLLNMDVEEYHLCHLVVLMQLQRGAGELHTVEMDASERGTSGSVMHLTGRKYVPLKISRGSL